MEQQRPSIFFSHAHDDNDICKKLVDDLKKDIPLLDEDDIFIDFHNLGPGTPFMDKIQREIVTRSIFIVALTPSSVNSNFVRSETNYAIQRAIDQSKRYIVLPILLMPCDPNQMAPFIMQFQVTNLTKDRTQEYQKLLKTLRYYRENGLSEKVQPVLDPTNQKIRDFRIDAEAALEESNWQMARLNADKGLQVHANDSIFLRIKARSYIGERIWTEAITILQQMKKDNAFDPDFWRMLAQTQEGMGEYHEAIDSLNKACSLEMDESKVARLLLMKRKLQMNVADYEGALQTINEEKKLPGRDPSLQGVYYDILLNLIEKKSRRVDFELQKLSASEDLKDLLFYAEHQGQIWGPLAQERVLVQIASKFPEEDLVGIRNRLGLKKYSLPSWTADEQLEKTIQWVQGLGFRLHVEGEIMYFEPPVQDIDAGEFSMGSDIFRDHEAFGEEESTHLVPIKKRYSIGRFPVTVAEYEMFVRMEGKEPKTQKKDVPGYGTVEVSWKDQLHHLDHPVVCVQWEEAMAYTEWLSKVSGNRWRLPSEAEWEKAARGTDGRIYPWGNRWNPYYCNTRWGRKWKATTTPIDHYPNGKSPYGVWDMAGNVWEWTISILYPYPYTEYREEREDTSMKDRGSHLRVLRGGAWLLKPRVARCACRNDDNEVEFVGYFFDVGFRLLLETH